MRVRKLEPYGDVLGLGLTSLLFDLIDLIAMGEGLSYLYVGCGVNGRHALIGVVLQLTDGVMKNICSVYR